MQIQKVIDLIMKIDLLAWLYDVILSMCALAFAFDV